MAEYHSGDLTAPCMRQVQLRWEGKYTLEMPTAMYRGSFASYVLEHLHKSGKWDMDGVAKAGAKALVSINADIKKERRTLSETVIRDRDEIHEEVIWVVREYAERLGPLFQQCKLIGCELPCRVTLGDYNFASHIDLLYRDTNDVFGQGKGRLCLWDFKYRDKVGWEYLARNHQLMLYCICGSMGQFQVDDFWLSFDQWPAVAWCHLPFLMPFKKRQVIKDEQGVEREYLKGEQRPLTTVVRWCDYKPERADDMIRELCVRPQMYEAGLFPMNPDPIGCQLCESKSWCPRMDMSQLNGELT